MIQNSTPITKTLYPELPVETAVLDKVIVFRQINVETEHQIYDRLIEHLSNPKIKAKKTDAILPYVLHSKTKEALLLEHGFLPDDIATLELSIIQDADENLNDYEVLRDVPAALYFELMRKDEIDMIFDIRIVPLPGAILNALVCEELQKEFSRKVLLSCDGFVEVQDTDDRGIIRKSIRLNIDDSIDQRGFMLPIYRDGLITALKIFLHPQDECPFRLKSRIKGGSNDN
ncbi:MAG: hypothetical protein ACR2L1_07500 [Pyrinomonadaceae bacterium]